MTEVFDYNLCILRNQALIGTIRDHSLNQTSVIHFQLNENINRLEYVKILNISYDIYQEHLPTIIGYNQSSYFLINYKSNSNYIVAVNSSGIQMNRQISIPTEFEGYPLDTQNYKFYYLDIQKHFYNMIIQTRPIYGEIGKAFYIRYFSSNLTISSIQPIITARNYHLDESNTLWAICNRDPIGGEHTSSVSKLSPIKNSFYGYSYSNGILGRINRTIQQKSSYVALFAGDTRLHYRLEMGLFVHNDEIIIPYYDQKINNGSSFTLFEGIAKYGINENPSLSREMKGFSQIQIIQGCAFLFFTISKIPVVREKLKYVFYKLKQETNLNL